MPTLRTLAPSRRFSLSIVVIGVVSLVSSVLFLQAMYTVQETADAAENTCSGELQQCMKSTQTMPECRECVASDGDIRTRSCQDCAGFKGLCQTEYSMCSKQGGKIHAW